MELLLLKPIYNLLKHSTNLAIIVSIEGSSEFTNKRGGTGVYEKALETIKCLDRIGVPTGISATITRINFRYWMNPENIDNLIKQNIRILFLIEYIPQTPLPRSKTKSADCLTKSSLDITPCPVSNIATHNLINTNLREGLASPLFKEICKNEHLLETEGMPCALFAHPEEASALAKLVGAYKTDLWKEQA